LSIENEDITLPRQVGILLPIDRVSHPRRTISAIIQLWYSQNSQPWVYKKWSEVFDWLSNC